MKVIMTPVANRPESKSALRAAADIATRLNANIVGCNLRPHRDLDGDYKPAGLSLFGSNNRRWLDKLNSTSTRSAAQQAQKVFSEIVTEFGLTLVKKPPLDASLTALWLEKVGSPDRLMAIMGPVADLTVVSRPSAKGYVARLFMLAALLHSGRPVLVLPPRQVKAVGRRIAIGWNQSAEISRAIEASMPILQAAEQVTIISCGPERRLGPKSSQMKTYLRYWGIKANIIRTRGSDEESELMSAYHDSSSDLLLMGAYSRSKLREVVFGGMTEYMLSRANIPVIMQHS